jgi:aromatic amino acid aminotransferase I
MTFCLLLAVTITLIQDNKCLLSVEIGLPHPGFFPFDEISATVYPKDIFPTETPSTKSSLFSWITRFFGISQSSRDELRIRRYAKHAGDLNLAKILQYGPSYGQTELNDIIREIVQQIYKPAYGNWTILIHSGNTDGWVRAVMTLCDPGDTILACEWTYPSAMVASRPLGMKIVSVATDGGGMRSDALLEILSSWNENDRGAPRSVLITYPMC